MKPEKVFLILFCALFSGALHALSMPAPPGHQLGGGQSGFCPMNYAPVCGANGKTYSNSCAARNDGQNQFNQGSCTPQNQGLGFDCVHCGGNPFYGNVRPNPQFPYFPGGVRAPFMQPAPMPWWGYYGQQHYPNFHYPGAWGNYGMNPRPYPGGGAAFAAKPNVYVNGPKNEVVKIEIEFLNNAQHLVSTPELRDSWEVKISQEGKLQHDQALYSYLFYDFRFDHNLAQYEKGECSDSKNLIPKMLGVLEQLNYNEQERKDFEEHWGVKIPFGNEFCFYPQFEQNLERIVSIKATNKEVELDVTRVLFIVQMMDSKGEMSFPPRPVEKHRVPAPSSEVSTSSVSVREWGVAFLSEDALKFSTR